MSGNAFERAFCYLSTEEKAKRFDAITLVLGWADRTGQESDSELLRQVIDATLNEPKEE